MAKAVVTDKSLLKSSEFRKERVMKQGYGQVVTIFVLAVACLCVSDFAEGATTFSLSVGEATVSPGDSGIAVDLYLTKDGSQPFIPGFDFEVVWDQAQFEFAGTVELNNAIVNAGIAPADVLVPLSGDPSRIKLLVKKLGIFDAVNNIPDSTEADPSAFATIYLNHIDATLCDAPDVCGDVASSITLENISGDGGESFTSAAGTATIQCPACVADSYELAMTEVAGCPGDEVTVDVLLSNTQPVQAVSVGIGFDPAVFTLTSVDPGTAVASFPNLEFLTNQDDGEGWSTIGIVVETGNVTPPATLAAGDDHQIITLTFLIDCAAAEGATPLAFEDGLGGSGPDTVVDNLVTVDNADITPDLVNGSVTVNADGALTFTAEQTAAYGPVSVAWGWDGGCGGPLTLVSVTRNGTALDITGITVADGGMTDAVCEASLPDGTYEYIVTVETSCGDTLTASDSADVMCERVYGFKVGDCNNSGGLIDIADALKILQLLFTSDEEIPGCILACDANSNGRITITDAVVVLSYLFQGYTDGPDGNCIEVPADPAFSCETPYCEVAK